MNMKNAMTIKKRAFMKPIHIGHLIDIFSLKNSELPDKTSIRP